MPKQLFEDDSQLDAGIRNANPFPVEQAPELDQRALDDLASILAAQPATNVSSGPAAEPAAKEAEEPAPSNVVALDAKRKTTRRWVLGALAAVAAGVLVAVPLGTSLKGASKAVAAPLSLTHLKPPTLSTKEAVEQLIAAAQAHRDGTDFKPGNLNIEHWEADSMFIPLDDQYPTFDMNDENPGESIVGIEGESDSRVSIPIKNEIRREEDGSGSIKQIVGEPFSITGQDVEFVPFAGNAKPGTVATYVFEPGEFMMMLPKAPPRTAKDFYDRIYGGLRPDSALTYDGPQGYIQTIGYMMSEWSLDQDQTLALLGTIPMIKDIEFMGTTRDRWNREAMVFGVDNRRENDLGGVYRTMMMFDPSTGRLINFAEEYQPDKNSVEKPDFEFDTVVRYIAVGE